MNATQRLLPILLFIFAGCEEPRVIVPQTPPEATGLAETVNLPSEQTTPPESPPERIEQVDQISGKVVGIIDGDTIDILTADETKIRIRLNGIDAPETGQPFGKNAKQYLSDTIGGHIVTVVLHEKDRYPALFQNDASRNFKTVMITVSALVLFWHLPKRHWTGHQIPTALQCWLPNE